MPHNPFLKIKVRSIFWVIILIVPLTIILSLLMGFFLGISAYFQNYNPEKINFSDPLFLTIIINICFYTSVSFWLFTKIKRSQLQLNFLIGKLPSNASWLHLLLITIPILLFSWGTGQLLYLLGSFIKPEIVTSLFDRQFFLTESETQYPVLYNSIQAISIIVAAPIMEEILFRGILFQRWAVKWNLITGTIVSSLVFGFLHFNVLGLFNFGVIMCILYLHTQTLYVPIFVHILNNFMAVAIELMASISQSEKTAHTIEQIQAAWWEPLIIIAISLPWLIYFGRSYWQGSRFILPYFANRDRVKLFRFQ